MISRRSFIGSIVAALAAAKFAEFPAFAAGADIGSFEAMLPPIDMMNGLQKFRVDFPDGTSFEFQGFVANLTQLNSGLTSMQISPAGPMSYKRADRPVNHTMITNDEGTAQLSVKDENGTIGYAEISEIESGGIERDMVETISGDFIPGIRRMGDFHITGKFQ